MSFEEQYQAEFAPMAEEYPIGSEVFANGKVYKVVDYEIYNNKPGVVGVDREGNEKSLYEFEKVLYRVCKRCGGSGRYSYNIKDGSRCYGCGGIGKQTLAPSGFPQRMKVECNEALARFRFNCGEKAICEFIGFSKTGGTPLYHVVKSEGPYKGVAYNIMMSTIHKHFNI